MINKRIFIATHQVFDKRFLSIYQDLMENRRIDYQTLEQEQVHMLRDMFQFCSDKVPYYQSLLSSLNFNPKDIHNVKDLEFLPLLTKSTIKEHISEFIPKNLNHLPHIQGSTSGSTGAPLHYRISKYDRLIGGCLLYRGWSNAGFELGDKLVTLAYYSLGVDNKSWILTKFHEFTSNMRNLSSFDMGDSQMDAYRKIINTFKPKYIRCYPSSMSHFAKWLTFNNLPTHKPVAVLSTAEKLFPEMRSLIEDVFHCPVFDGYGLYDGGISAYELPDHSGMRIDTERSILEVVNDQGNQIMEGTGRIIATSLLNKSFPFIRYDTGDIGTVRISTKGERILTQIEGRQQEMLLTPEGKYIHGQFIASLLHKKIRQIQSFQVIQEDLYHINIHIVPESGFLQDQLKVITKFIHNKSPQWKINYDLVDQIPLTSAGKHRFVINRLNEK